MILTIAIENTSMSIGCFQNEKLQFVESISTNVGRTELEYAISFKNIFELHQLDVNDVEGAIISSVVPPITNIVKTAVKRIFKKDALVIGPGVKTGLNIITENPAQLGNDLAANAVAAIAKYEAPMLIVNMGTATTISVINEKKQYIGGMIIPGMKVSSSALTKATAQLPNISLEKPKKAIGANTVECMKSGLIYGTAACIDGSIARIEKELKAPVATIVATGEDIRHILPYCERKMCLDEALLLEGLHLIYERNHR